MELPIILTIVFTLLSPFVTAFFNRVQWSSETKNLVAIAVSVAIAIIYVLMTGGIADWSQLAVVAPVIYSLQQVIYQFFVKGVAKKIELETTSPESLAGLAAHHPLQTTTVTTVTTTPDPTPEPNIFEPIHSDTPAKG